MPANDRTPRRPGDPATPGRASSTELPIRAFVTILAATSGAAAPVAHLVILSQDSAEPAEAAVRKLAALLNLDGWSARQRLLFPAPQILRRFEDRAAADTMAEALSAAGMKTFVLPESELRECAPRTICSIAPGPRSFAVTHLDGTAESIPIVDMVSIAIGQLRERIIIEHSQRSGLAGLTHGEGSGVLHEERRTIVDLHRISTGALLRLDQLELDFQPLFPGRAQGSALMMKSLLDWLRKSAPQAAVYDEFNLVSGKYSASWEVLERHTEFVAGFLRGCFSGPSGLVDTRIIRDSELANFQLYSALARAESFRRRAAAAPQDRD